jgi:hypothetical protein
MKTKLLLVLAPALFLVTACSQSESSAAADLTRACKLVNNETKATIPNVAIQFFASAAREDINYLPLAAAARIAGYNFWEASESVRAEMAKSSNLVRAYCTPRTAK